MSDIKTEDALKTLQLEGSVGLLQKHVAFQSQLLGITSGFVHSADYSLGFARSVGAMAKRFATRDIYKTIGTATKARPITIQDLFDLKIFSYPALHKRVAGVSYDELRKLPHPNKSIHNLTAEDMVAYHDGAQKQIMLARAILDITNNFAKAPIPDTAPKTPVWDAAAKEVLMQKTGDLADTDVAFRRKLASLVRRYSKPSPTPNS